MKNKVQFVFGVLTATVFAAAVSGQGIGDRNRAADSQGGNYSIQGRVILPDGTPAANARVSISSVDSPGASTVTDQDGSFQTGSISGNYTVAVKIEGYQQESEFLTIDRDTPAGRTFTVVLHMRLPGQKKGDIYSGNPLFKDVPKTALEKFKKGMDKIQGGDAKAAIPHFDAAIAEYPNFAAAYYERGSAYLNQKNLDAAVESFVKAITIKADYFEAKYGYGLAMFEKKNYEVSEAVFRDVLKTRDMAEAHLNLGISLFYLKDQAAAEVELKNAVAAKGGDKLAMAHLYLGQIYLQRKQNASAITELEKYLELAPKAPNADRIKTAITDLKKQG